MGRPARGRRRPARRGLRRRADPDKLVCGDEALTTAQQLSHEVRRLEIEVRRRRQEGAEMTQEIEDSEEEDDSCSSSEDGRSAAVLKGGWDLLDNPKEGRKRTSSLGSHQGRRA